MSIMRRGPLDRYPAGWLLREAAKTGLDGSIDFAIDKPVTLFFDGGQIYASVVAGAALTDEDIDHGDEQRLRARTVQRIVDALCATGGTYFYDALGTHPTRGWWSWDVDVLLQEARTRSPEATAAFVLANRLIDLKPQQPTPVTLEPDAWAVVAALASSATAEEIRTRLGWGPTRLLTALNRLNQAKVLDPNPQRREPVAHAAGDRPSADRPVPAVDAPPDPMQREIDLAMELAIARSAATAEVDNPPEPTHAKEDLGTGANAPSSSAFVAWQRIAPEVPPPLQGPAAPPPEAPAPSRWPGRRRR